MTQLKDVIKFVAEMNEALKFYRDVIGLELKFESPDWSEFATGSVSDKNPSRKSGTEPYCSRCRGLPTRRVSCRHK
jgi:catechol 2,3-dioxygenase-like lactoylglutathione lyase family enzyme